MRPAPRATSDRVFSAAREAASRASRAEPGRSQIQIDAAPRSLASANRLPPGPSIEREFVFPRVVLIRFRLRAFCQYEIFDHQIIHLGSHEAAVCILGGTYDGLAAHVE